MRKIIPLLLLICLGFRGYSQDNPVEMFSSAFQISLVSVDTGTWNNMVIWQKTDPQIIIDSSQGRLSEFNIHYYNIFRYDSTIQSYKNIGTKDYSELPVFIDTGSYPKLKTYKYKINAHISYRLSFSMAPLEEADTYLDSCRYHKTLFIEKESSQDTVTIHIDPYKVENFDMTMFFDTLMVHIFRSKDSSNILDHLYDSVYYEIGDSLFTYSDPDTTAKDSGFYYIGVVELQETIDPLEFVGLKASGGPFTQAISNLEDNRLKEGEAVFISKKAEQNDCSLQVSPNPVRNHAEVSFALKEDCEVKLSIFSRQGKLIRHMVNQKLSAGQYKIYLDINNMVNPNGLYYISMITNKKKEVRKLILVE
jgi:hypothetical protein